ncbi:CoA-disulfide reductase [Metabacillus fastidiosus]|uniref:CoA-disulfide reductase n=1 Tax=Metabacillus fastidiosus TaxID=1458 RepID=UPI002E1D2EDF|nr:CoA-disulfide reductase [Metabacillus fastidiosus]MED4534888.1 CoA-disulfide reductase [Metabacillus fastidiosus]
MRYVIIGGDAAGMSAAMEIVRNDKEAEIITLERGEIYSYGQCGLPYVIDGRIPSTDKVIARSVETFREKYGIDARTGHEVTGVNPENKVVTGRNVHSGETFEIPYDKLLIGTGASPVLPPWDGINLQGIHTLKTIPDTEAILSDLKGDVHNVTIIGGGYIGLEAAEAFTMLGKKVRLIQRGDQVAKIFDPDMAAHIHEEAKKQGVELILDEQVESFSGKEKVEQVKTDKGTYPTDLVLIAVGIKPETKFLKDSGIIRSDNGAIVVNAYMETNVADIYAAGDCVLHFHLVKQKNDYIPLGTTANKQGRIAGRNMAGRSEIFKGVVGTSILKFFDLELGRTGLAEKDAKKLRIPYESHTLEARDIAGYYPGKQTIYVKLLYRKDNGQLLGGQVIGRNGVDKRIDVLATALYNRMTLKDLLDLDLAYAPPFNGTWDPIQQVARRKS